MSISVPVTLSAIALEVVVEQRGYCGVRGVRSVE